MKTVKVERPFDADELIGATRKCREKVEVCLAASGMLQPLVSYAPKQFLEHLRRFRRALEPPRREHEELTLVLELDKTMIEFHAKPRP